MSNDAATRDEVIFTALAKWERHAVGHSLGHLNLSHDRLWFVPHKTISILAQGFDLPVASIRSVERSDNWLWRGAINIHLREPLRLDIEFRLKPDDLVPGVEQRTFTADKLRLFLGFSREKFFREAMRVGLAVENKG